MRWLILVLWHIVLSIVGALILAPLLWWLPDTAKRLPQWAVWWDNYTDGIDGDPDHRDRRAKDWSVWARRYVWLAVRNRVHNWSRFVGCVQATAEVAHVGTLPSDYEGREGHLLTIARSESGTYHWQDYGCWKWPGLDRCVRWRLGDKFRLVTPDMPLPPGYIAALCYYFHPFKKFGPRG